MDTSRYQLVDSLYGPGTVGAWLLTICAVFISWTLNASSRRKDTISIDFIAMLLLPMIAAGHLVFQIVRLPFSVVETITAQDIEVQKYASAIEAPLNVCETFSMVGLLLAYCCGPWWGSHLKRKRLGPVLVVGLLSWGTENVMFVMATMKGVEFVDTTLTRPYLFFLTLLVTTTWGFLTLCGIAGGIVWIRHQLNATRVQNTERDQTLGEWAQIYPLQVPKSRNNLSRTTRDLVERVDVRWEHEMQAQRNLVQNGIALSFIFFFSIPLVILSGLASSGGLYSLYESRPSLKKYQGEFILIPKSNGSIANLDQILALVGGFIVLLSAVRRAYRSRVDNEQTSKEIIQRRASI